ncbi:MAG: hypothetical protein PHC34_02595 [Candidatus Gastranaerophilales bacterium]|nr:hypothetical protein [Candidatus Gastranaerophilales bacterium]
MSKYYLREISYLLEGTNLNSKTKELLEGFKTWIDNGNSLTPKQLQTLKDIEKMDQDCTKYLSLIDKYLAIKEYDINNDCDSFKLEKIREQMLNYSVIYPNQKNDIDRVNNSNAYNQIKTEEHQEEVKKYKLRQASMRQEAKKENKENKWSIYD